MTHGGPFQPLPFCDSVKGAEGGEEMGAECNAEISCSP